MKLTKKEQTEYKDLLNDLFLSRLVYLRADYKLSYKRERNKQIYYYLSVFNYKIVYKDNKAMKLYTTVYKHYNTYKKMKIYIMKISTYYKRYTFKEYLQLYKADHRDFEKELRALDT